MTRIERRVLTNCLLIGTLVTSIVVLAELAGWLQVSENWMYDLRARHFQFFQPPPTDQLVHLDIDDKALEGIGRWPWPRSQMASFIDEIHAAGAKAVGLDIIYADPQPATLVTDSPPPPGPTTAPATGHWVDHDALLAAAVKRANCVILPGSFILAAPATDPLYETSLQAMSADIELTESDFAAVLHQKFPQNAGLDSLVTNLYLQARHDAVYARIEQELAKGPRSAEQLRKVLVHRQDGLTNSPLSRLIDEQFPRVEAAMNLASFGVPPPPGDMPFISAKLKLAPVITLGRTMAATSFVDFKEASRDGVLRTQPLMLDCDGRLFPQFGFSLALFYLGASPKDVSFTSSNATVICPDGRKIQIPINEIYSDTLRQRVSGMFNIPWFGNRDWESMYDWPNHQNTRQHLSMNTVQELVLTKEKIHKNNDSADEALLNWSIYRGLPPNDPPKNDTALSRLPDLRSFQEDAKSLLEMFQSVRPEEMSDTDRRLVATLKAYNDGRPDEKAVAKLPKPEQKIVDNLMIARSVLDQNPRLGEQLEIEQVNLRHDISGKAVLVGFTATGNQDAVPTSLHPRCPGVVTHGVIFNAIVSGHFWTVAPEWVTILFAVVLGGLTAAVAWRFPPLTAFLITSAFGISYVSLNGLFFFNHLGQIVGLAAPQIAMAGVWSGCSLARIVIETSERQRIVRRFRSYVDPKVVNFMMERPDEVKMDGETRELTVCFSDIAGFTTLSERLGDGIVPVLNEFMDLMVPIIREQHGTVDKFLGDGIMFFFGAPVPDSQHAADAVAAALLMQQALGTFNTHLAGRGLPTIGVRIGINTGLMTVGDAGSTDAADYTVIGDNVNLASRLESANKQLGTAILISARTAELAGDRFLLRPVASLQVVGKTEGVRTFTVCGLADGADSKQLKLCEVTRRMVDSFRNSDFNNSLAAANELDELFGPSDLTETYQELCIRYLAEPPPASFDGTIILSEK